MIKLTYTQTHKKERLAAKHPDWPEEDILWEVYTTGQKVACFLGTTMGVVTLVVLCHLLILMAVCL